MPTFVFNRESEDGHRGTDGVRVVAATESQARAFLGAHPEAAEEPKLTLVSVDGTVVD